MPGVLTFDEVSWLEVLEVWPSELRDFGDAVLTVAARLRKHDSIATFDQRFVRALRRLGVETHWGTESTEDGELETDD